MSKNRLRAIRTEEGLRSILPRSLRGGWQAGPIATAYSAAGHSARRVRHDPPGKYPGNPYLTKPEHRAAYSSRRRRHRGGEFGFPWAMWSHGGAFGIAMNSTIGRPNPMCWTWYAASTASPPGRSARTDRDQSSSWKRLICFLREVLGRLHPRWRQALAVSTRAARGSLDETPAG